MRIDISGASAVIRNQDILTVGMVGAKAEFRFGEEWNGLSKIAVFRQGGVSKDVTITSSFATIPWEVLRSPGLPVSIGVYGANSGGTVVIPTIWVDTRPLRSGADPSGDESADPTPSVWAEMLGKISDIESAAGEHAANSAPPIVVKKSGVSITVSDSANRALQSLKLYGKTTQGGIPTPDNPVELGSLGDSGSVSVTVSSGDQTASAVFSNHVLGGVPVSTAGNYTDANGQQWVCDEFDFSKGVYVQRIGKATVSSWKLCDGFSAGTSELFEADVKALGAITTAYETRALCNKFAVVPGIVISEMQGFYIGYGKIYARIPGVMDADEFNEKVGTAEVLYVLNQPAETPMLIEELAAYNALRTYRATTTVRNDVFAHMELEYIADTKTYIDNHSPSGVAAVAKTANVVLLAKNWVTQSENLHSQVVAISGTTERSQVDLTPSKEQLLIFYDKDLTFGTENEDGVITVYVIGQKPLNDYTIAATITEVNV